MMLQFPNLSVFRLCLTNGDIPVEVSTQPVKAAILETGTVAVVPAKKLPSKSQKALQKLDVKVLKKATNTAELQDYLCWPQILPLERSADPRAQQKATLFELTKAAHLPELAAEMLKMGNDRQSFRFLSENGTKTDTILLRVMEPPYYSLLRALDRNGQSDAPRAYVEHQPDVWVEIGYTHPFVEMVKPPKNSLMLLQPTHDWRVIPEGEYRDIYEVLEFALPQTKTSWKEQSWETPISVPLRLTAGHMSAPAELWVLRENAQEQVETFIRSAGDQLLSRLLFVVAEKDGQTTVVLRTRPSRQSPPVLVLDAVGFRPFLKLPNLFLPCGTNLHPPLRREAIRRLLAEDNEILTWLYPLEEEDGFVPESLPDRAFRPLSEWVNYVLTCEETALQSWIESSQFEFDSFICKDDLSDRKKKKPKDEPEKERDRRSRPKRDNEDDVEIMETVTESVSAEEEVLEELIAETRNIKPNELQNRQAELQQQFLDVDGPLDDPARLELWPELAAVYSALKNDSDAALCWVNALWEKDGEGTGFVRQWHKGEQRNLGKKQLKTVLDEILRHKEPNPPQLRLLASSVMEAAHSKQPNPIVVERLNPIRSKLEEHDYQLPVRTVWLTARALAKLTGDDVLFLARTRDRILERLYKSGLMPELDLPNFLRFTGTGFNDRIKEFRDWLDQLPDRVENWLAHVNDAVVLSDTVAKQSKLATIAYAKLILAYGFARLGESNQTRKLHNQAKTTLSEIGQDVHHFLLSAFGARIEEATRGDMPTSSLPTHIMEHLSHMDKMPRYVVDRLRQHSQILEPHEKVDPYRSWHGHRDDLGKILATLPDIYEKDKLQQTILNLYAKYGKKGKTSSEDRLRILLVALDVAPRVGEEFAVSQLMEVKPIVKAIKDIMVKTDLLEKALFVAAHFDQRDHVHYVIAEFRELMKGKRDNTHAKALERLASQSIRGLRKLGMREEIQGLLGNIHDALTGKQTLKDLRNREDWSVTIRSLLHVASGWYYFGQADKAKPIVDEARQLLYSDKLSRQEKRELACALVNTLGQAPLNLALRGLDELFTKLKGISDTFTTNAYYGLSQLDVIEMVVLSIITEDFAVGGMARRWLDEDEFLVRRRIHQDLHSLMKS